MSKKKAPGEVKILNRKKKQNEHNPDLHPMQREGP